MSLIMKDFAPLDVRLKAALGRMKQVPDLFDQARKNLVLKWCRQSGLI